MARQTWFLLTVKLLTAEILAALAGRPSPAAQWRNADTAGGLRREVEALEHGPLIAQLRGGDGPGGDDPPAWYLDAWSAEIAQTVRELAAVVAEYPRAMIVGAAGGGHDLFKPLYEAVFPRTLRHALGEYYTPNWLAEHVLDQVRLPGPARRPAAGPGLRFRRLPDGGHPAPGGPAAVTIWPGASSKTSSAWNSIPWRRIGARANYLLAIVDLLPSQAAVEIPVYRCDAILDAPESDRQKTFPIFADEGHENATVPLGNPFEFRCGQSALDRLGQSARRPIARRLSRCGSATACFRLSGNEARHGGGKKDLAMLMLYRAADRYLAPGGRLGMVVTQSLFQTKAGDGFRRFRLGAEGDWLRVDRVDDLAALKPFPGAASRTATIALTKGARTQYPVPYVKWTPRVENGDSPHLCADQRCASVPASGRFRRKGTVPFFHVCRARPIDPQRPGSPWLICLPEESAGQTFPPDATGGRGASDYEAHLGANSGGANAVYWLRLIERSADGDVVVENLLAKAKRGVPAVRQTIEPELLYPLLRWGDVGRWSARPSANILLAQDVDSRTGIAEDLMRREYPRTYRYLEQFEPLLSSRAAYRRYQGQKPFYSMYNVGPYTVAPIKVVWRRMERMIRAAVVEPVDEPLLGRRPLVPQETCVLIACASADEAHYLCAVLNSQRTGALVAAHSVVGGKGFGTPGMLEYLGLRRFDASDRRHAALAACSRQAHELASKRHTPCADDFSAIQREIDRLAAEL